MFTGQANTEQGVTSGSSTGLTTSAALLQDFISTPGAYVRDTFKQAKQNVIDATKMFGDLQLGIGTMESATDGVLVSEYKDPQIEWFNYVLARHRSFQ